MNKRIFSGISIAAILAQSLCAALYENVAMVEGVSQFTGSFNAAASPGVNTWAFVRIGYEYDGGAPASSEISGVTLGGLNLTKASTSDDYILEGSRSVGAHLYYADVSSLSAGSWDLIVSEATDIAFRDNYMDAGIWLVDDVGGIRSVSSYTALDDTQVDSKNTSFLFNGTADQPVLTAGSSALTAQAGDTILYTLTSGFQQGSYATNGLLSEDLALLTGSSSYFAGQMIAAGANPVFGADYENLSAEVWSHFYRNAVTGIAIQSIPEPSMFLLGLGGMAMLILRRRN